MTDTGDTDDPTGSRPGRRRGLERLRGTDGTSAGATPSSPADPAAADEHPGAGTAAAPAGDEEAAPQAARLPEDEVAASERAAAAADAGPPTTTRSARRPAPALVGFTALMALAVVALAVLLGTGSSAGASSGTGLQQQFDRRTALISSARQFSVNFFTYDYRRLGPAFAQVEAQSANPFLADYKSKEGQLRTLLPQAKVVATATVSAAGVSIIAQDKGVVLLTVDQNVANVLKKSAQNRYRIKLTMQETSKGWVATDVTPVT